MTARKLAGYAILATLGLLLFCAVANDVGWIRALTVGGAVAGFCGAIFLSVWLIVE